MMKIGSQEERKLHNCALADLLPIGIFYADVQGRYLAVNEYWCEIARVMPSQSQGDGWIQSVYPDDQKLVFAAWKQAVQNHLKFRYEYRFQHPDGTLTWVLSQAIPETDSKGVVIGYVGTITDITERKQTEAELHQRCHRLESLLQKYTTQCQHTHQQLQQETFKCQCLEEALQQSEALSSCLTQNITQLQQTEETLALRNRELLTLHRISEIHLSTQSLQAAFQEIVEEISSATNFPICAIELYDASRQMMVFEAVKGVPLPDNSGVLEVPADQTLSGTVVLTGKPVIKIYAPNEPKNCDSNETLKKLGIKTFICMPMKIHERTIGTLSLAHSQVVQLDEYLPQWIASLANYVASLTEHKRAQTELRQVNERFKLATTAVNGLIYDWNLETNQVQRTQELVNLLGYHPEEAEPMAAWWRERIHPDDWLRLNPVVVQALVHEEMYALEYRIRHKNNQYLHVWDRGLILRDTQGRAVRVVGSTMDITARKRMEETLQQQCLREQLLGTISQRIHQSFNLSEILQTTVAEIRHFLACDRVIIYRFQPDWSGIVAAESVGALWQPIAGTLINDCCFAQSYAQLYQQGRVQAIEDIYNAGLSACHIELLAQYQVRASLIAPIVADNEQLWGLLVAYQCSGTRQWQSLEIDLLKHLATQAAIAIQKSELYELSQTQLMQRQQAEAALRQQVLKERLMSESAQRIRQSLNLDEILNTTVAEVRQFLDCDRTLIFRFESDWSGVVAVESVGEEWTAILGTTIYDPCFELSYIQPYQAGRVKPISDIYAAGLNQCHIDLLAQFQVKANLVVPILQGKRLWGLLIAHQCRGKRQWQALEIDLLKQLATQVGIAIQQSQLYKQSRIATAQALSQAEELEQTLNTLQKTQAQLVHSEKMSSLGQLVAGVAHEINNPVTFISANLTHAENYTQDILGLIELYQQQYPEPTPDIESEMEAIDLEFLIDDLPKLLSSMKVGADRICEIILALRNFSRHAEAEIKAVDIHEGLDSTLMILQNRLKASGKHPEIQVIKEYGNLPKVECCPGQLNQVFMNLLSNAIDAIDEYNETRSVEEIKTNPSIISIHTQVGNESQVVIHIADNGPGMKPQIQSRIFDPFFTTKPVGAGTGLGLSISYQIVVEKHGGQLYCESVLGQGTQFVIEIPIGQMGVD